MQILPFTLFLVLLPEVFCYDCSNSPDGVYDQGCREFIQCVNHIANLITCHGNHVFNRNNGRCDDPHNVPPPCGVYRNCTEIPDGSYPDYEQHCRTYYTCHGGIFFGHNFCTPDGLFFGGPYEEHGCAATAKIPAWPPWFCHRYSFQYHDQHM